MRSYSLKTVKVDSEKISHRVEFSESDSGVFDITINGVIRNFRKPNDITVDLRNSFKGDKGWFAKVHIAPAMQLLIDWIYKTHEKEIKANDGYEITFKVDSGNGPFPATTDIVGKVIDVAKKQAKSSGTDNADAM